MSLSNPQVAEAYARGVGDARSKNMFIKGETIYSYGYHFPIATRTGQYVRGYEVVLFNRDGYSNTTARHKSRVAQALSSDYILLEVSGELIREYARNGYIKPETGENEIKRLELIKDGYTLRSNRARLDRMKESWAINARNIAGDIASLKTLELYR